MSRKYGKPSDKTRADGDRPKNVQIGALADEDALVLIKFLDYKDEVQTVNGPSDAIAAHLLVITGAHAGLFEEDRLIFNKAIVGKFEDAVKGDDMLAHVSWGRSKTTARKYATLTDPEEGDEALADKALEALADPPF